MSQVKNVKVLISQGWFYSLQEQLEVEKWRQQTGWKWSRNTDSAAVFSKIISDVYF